MADTSKLSFLRSAFNYAIGYGPALGLMVGGGMVAADYGATQRLDILLGGLTLSFLGLAIADAVSGRNVMSHRFMNAATGRTIDPGTLTGLTGLTSVALLGGGEVLNMSQKYNWGFGNLTDAAALAKIWADPAIYKIMANFTAYTAISLMDFPLVARKAQDYMSENKYRWLQTALSLAGAAMILKFGADGRIFSAKRFAQISLVSGSAKIAERTIQEIRAPSAAP